MNVEDHTKIIQEIAQNLTDSAKVTELLTSLSNDYAEVIPVVAKNVELESNMEQLRQANMKLFLQVGAVPKDTPPTPIGQPEPPIITTEEPKQFESLFNEKGELI